MDAKIEGALAQFDLNLRTSAGGWGQILETVYDGAIEELEALNATFAQAFTLIADD
ncbi:hypothetical protein KRR38_01465 [Novosphingobium sp. G106]|uniref:hypothetical protein n=1 Tax=Novosphingobium sp. G106 TaxID=2849500 RepID=UPI001C2CFE0E|nr:hypothetical protein [Novosphingobium sp. G106]MBV1686373.1 hypothetical protein [Novosphingobium sp. G106]